MNKLSPEKEEEILKYLDGTLEFSKKENLEIELQENQLLKNEMEVQETIQRFLKRRAVIEIPSKTFTQKVMAGLTVRPSVTFSPRKGLLLLIGVIIASGLALVLLSNGAFDQTQTTLLVDATPLKNKWMTLPSFSVPFNGKILVNSIIFLNLGLALVLLDRTILRPLFQKRATVGY
jgi:hypothetical protein